MQIFHRVGRALSRFVVAAVVGTVAAISTLLDASIALVGRSSQRLDATCAELARESRARRAQQGRRQIDPISLS